MIEIDKTNKEKKPNKLFQNSYITASVEENLLFSMIYLSKILELGNIELELNLKNIDKNIINLGKEIEKKLENINYKEINLNELNDSLNSVKENILNLTRSKKLNEHTNLLRNLFTKIDDEILSIQKFKKTLEENSIGGIEVDAEAIKKEKEIKFSLFHAMKNLHTGLGISGDVIEGNDVTENIINLTNNILNNSDKINGENIEYSIRWIKNMLNFTKENINELVKNHVLKTDENEIKLTETMFEKLYELKDQIDKILIDMKENIDTEEEIEYYTGYIEGEIAKEEDLEKTILELMEHNSEEIDKGIQEKIAKNEKIIEKNEELKEKNQEIEDLNKRKTEEENLIKQLEKEIEEIDINIDKIEENNIGTLSIINDIDSNVNKEELRKIYRKNIGKVGNLNHDKIEKNGRINRMRREMTRAIKEINNEKNKILKDIEFKKGKIKTEIKEKLKEMLKKKYKANEGKESNYMSFDLTEVEGMIELYSTIEKDDQEKQEFQILNYYILNYVFSMYCKDYCENNPESINTTKWKTLIEELKTNESFNNFSILDSEIKNQDIMQIISSVIGIEDTETNISEMVFMKISGELLNKLTRTKNKEKTLNRYPNLIIKLKKDYDEKFPKKISK